MTVVLSRVGKFFKDNIIFSVILVIALSSCFFVPIDKNYLDYFEWGTLTCIFLILLVVAGLSNIDFFHKVARLIVRRFKTTRAIIMSLIFITYISSMINANDMALLTFLPLSYVVLKYTNNLKYAAFTFVMQNIASNLGGMITPVGNPQNLYLFSFYNIGVLEFFKIMLLPTLFALLLILIVCVFIKNTKIEFVDTYDTNFDKKRSFIYLALFTFVILIVIRTIPWYVGLFVIPFVMFFCDKKAFAKVDYTIVLTFVAFFIFSGNIARIEGITNFLTTQVNKNTFFISYISCQFISNVPTAVLLSKFTTNYPQLLVAVNVASLGIIFSSLSGIIALKEYSKLAKKENLPKKYGAMYYIWIDTLFNVVGIFILYPLSYFTIGLL